MKWKELERHTRHNITGVLILLVGLAGAVAIYITAEQAAADAVGYDLAAGNAYGISPESSKRYIHDLELYGGKMAVMADEMNRWFNGLWRGTNLAFTVACIAVVVAAGFFLAARQEPSAPETDAPAAPDRTEAD